MIKRDWAGRAYGAEDTGDRREVSVSNLEMRQEKQLQRSLICTAVTWTLVVCLCGDSFHPLLYCDLHYRCNWSSHEIHPRHQIPRQLGSLMSYIHRLNTKYHSQHFRSWFYKNHAHCLRMSVWKGWNWINLRAQLLNHFGASRPTKAVCHKSISSSCTKVIIVASIHAESNVKEQQQVVWLETWQWPEGRMYVCQHSCHRGKK